jgi:ABC-type Na+ efflux pump permease subunit
MTTPWPSDRPSQSRTSKSPKAKPHPVDWFSGWMVTLFIFTVVSAMALLIIWPMAAHAMETVQQLTDMLEKGPRP